jgi:hypothetical protein
MDGYTHGYIHMDIVMDASMGIPMDIVMDESINTFIIDSSHIGIDTSYSYGPFYLVMYRLYSGCGFHCNSSKCSYSLWRSC